MATGWNSERQPLLRNENVNYSQYTEGQPTAPSYNEVNAPPYVQVSTPVPTIEPNELPPSYTSTHGTNPVVTCRICGLTIDISGKDDQHVVQCSYCHEATPIKCAPAGKKYVRCPCNCLLICKVSSKKISCPRENCKRIICVSPSSIANVPHSPGMCQVSCPYCQSCFSVNLIQNNCVRCIYCRKRCALIPEYARKRALTNFATASSALISFIIIVATTHQFLSTVSGLYVVYLLLPALFIACLIRSFFYFALKAVILETPS